MDRCIEFIKHFNINDKFNFFITLNQDLLVERIFLKSGEYKQYPPNDGIYLNFPYNNFSFETVIRRSPNYNNCIKRINQYQFDDFIQVIKYEENHPILKGAINYLKVHGSSNWEHSDDKKMIICGHKKESAIANNSIIKATYDLFEQIVQFENLKIVVIGYGFGDDHINKCIKTAKDNKGKLFIIDPTPPQDSKCTPEKIEFDEYICRNFSDFMTNRYKADYDKFLSWISEN